MDDHDSNAIGELFDDADNNNYALILDSLLDKNKNINRSTRYGGLHLKSFEEIREICQTNNRHFDLERFQLKFLKLIRRWTELALPVPELVKLQYGVSKGNDSRVGETMDISYENKENIHELAVGSDTKPAAVDHPSNKNQNKRGKFLEKKTSLVMDEVDDDIVSSEEENEDDIGAVATLKRKRKALKKSVKDPLEKCVAIAASAPTHQRKTCSEDDDSDDGISNNVAKKSSFLQKKATAKKLAWSDSSDDDESEKSESEGVALSAIPDRFESSDQGKAPTQAPREIQISLTTTTKKRNKFTESEDMAIKNGLRRFGEGNWVQIKSYYAIELKDRGAVQIKDRYRTLKKNNEI